MTDTPAIPDLLGPERPQGASLPQAGGTAWFRDALRVQARVIGALTLRDVRTRFGGSYLSYAISIAWPLTHFAVLVLIYEVFSRPPSYGTDLLPWVVSGALPFVIFLYSGRLIAQALSARSLLWFPLIKSIDLLLARILSELVTAVVLTTLIFASLYLYLGKGVFHDFTTCILAVLSAFYLGIGFGLFAAPIMRIFPAALIVVYLFMIVMWAASGIFFLPDSIPEPYHWYFSLNPLVHCFEYLRTGLFADYQTRTLNLSYAMTLASVLALLGLAGDRYLPRIASWAT